MRAPWGAVCNGDRPRARARRSGFEGDVELATVVAVHRPAVVSIGHTEVPSDGDARDCHIGTSRVAQREGLILGADGVQDLVGERQPGGRHKETLSRSDTETRQALDLRTARVAVGDRNLSGADASRRRGESDTVVAAPGRNQSASAVVEGEGKI